MSGPASYAALAARRCPARPTPGRRDGMQVTDPDNGPDEFPTGPRRSPCCRVAWSSGRPDRRPEQPAAHGWPQDQSGGVGNRPRMGDAVSDLGRRWVERATGIEPAPSVWKTEALPLSYARDHPALAGRARQPTESPNRTRGPVPCAAPNHRRRAPGDRPAGLDGIDSSSPRGVAQLGSALALGARGRGFKSRHPDCRSRPGRPGTADFFRAVPGRCRCRRPARLHSMRANTPRLN